MNFTQNEDDTYEAEMSKNVTKLYKINNNTKE